MAIKRDEGKPPLALVPTALIAETAHVYAFGQRKHGEHAINGRNPVQLSGFERELLLSAALRHCHALLDGQDNDPETGLSHEAHVAANMGILLMSRKLQEKKVQSQLDILQRHIASEQRRPDAPSWYTREQLIGMVMDVYTEALREREEWEKRNALAEKLREGM